MSRFDPFVSLDNVMRLSDAKGCSPLFISIIAPSGKALSNNNFLFWRPDEPQMGCQKRKLLFDRA